MLSSGISCLVAAELAGCRSQQGKQNPRERMDAQVQPQWTLWQSRLPVPTISALTDNTGPVTWVYWPRNRMDKCLTPSKMH